MFRKKKKQTKETGEKHRYGMKNIYYLGTSAYGNIIAKTDKHIQKE